MDLLLLKNRIKTSPAFILDEKAIHAAMAKLANLCLSSGCKLLYSTKALPLVQLLNLFHHNTDGFSVSSLFEARLAAEVLKGKGGIHLATPGIRPDELEELASLCSHISCNTLYQYRLFTNLAHPKASIGIRINPKLSFSQDSRHDPCRLHSKLGVSIDALIDFGIGKNIKGLHFHTVYSATDFAPLNQTLAKMRHELGANLSRLEWINLGGGYLFNAIEDLSPFIELVSQLKMDFGVEVYIEPGNALVGHAGYLLATVIDLFDSDGKAVAVLDTSINHQPQVFEYQRSPELAEHDADGEYSAILVGNTCLAGDIFGEYRFNSPLAIGDKVVFKNVGAYSLVKANRFNGYNLPDIYWANDDQIQCIKHYHYRDYRQQWLCD